MRSASLGGINGWTRSLGSFGEVTNDVFPWHFQIRSSTDSRAYRDRSVERPFIVYYVCFIRNIPVCPVSSVSYRTEANRSIGLRPYVQQKALIHDDIEQQVKSLLGRHGL